MFISLLISQQHNCERIGQEGEKHNLFPLKFRSFVETRVQHIGEIWCSNILKTSSSVYLEDDLEVFFFTKCEELGTSTKFCISASRSTGFY